MKIRFGLCSRSLWLGCLAILLASLPSHAQPSGPLEQNWYISLGAFFLDTDTTMRVDGVRGRGTEVNFGEDLGFRDKDRFRIDGFWRFAPRHKLRFLYFRNTLTAGRTIQRAIQFRDTVYPINAGIDAEFETEIAEVAYEYAFVHDNRFELTGTLGLHLIRFSATLAGEGGLLDGELMHVQSRASGDGPLPVVGVRGLWDIGGDLFLDAQAQFMAVDVNDYDGRIEDYKLALIWQAFPHLGIGIAYNDFSTRLDADERGFRGRLGFDYRGPLAFITASF